MHDIQQRKQVGWNRTKSNFSNPHSQRTPSLSFASNKTFINNYGRETTNTSINSEDVSAGDSQNDTSVEYQEIPRNHQSDCSVSNEDIKSKTQCSKNFLYILTFALISFIVVILKAKIGAGNGALLKNCSFDDLRKMFPKESQRMWFDLSVGIENILNHNVDKPGVYLFTHKNKEYANHLVAKIAEKSSFCYDIKRRPVDLGEEFFRNDDYGHIIESFRKTIKQSRVVLISNLNEIPALSARALHSICDTYSPIDKNVIIYLTLVPSFFNENPTSNARQTLTTLWGSKLPQNELDALITRVTDAVIQLQG